MTTNLNAADPRDERLMTIFGELTAAVMKRGFDFAQIDDPHNFAVAAKWLATPGCRLELRIALRPGQAEISTVGYVVDEGGESLARVFEIAARPATEPAQ